MNKDYHVHTNYSKDASIEATFQNYIEEAKKKGIETIAFTDHHDIDPAHPLFATPIDYDIYIKDFNKVRDATKFNMILGVEVGYQSHTIKELDEFLDKYPFEYVIMSVHYIEKKDLYTKEFFEGKTKFEAYQIYFETCLAAIQSTNKFDTFGHMDYITRYSPFGDYDYINHKVIIDQILKELIKKGKNLEINTSGYKTENRQYPKKEVVRRYIELGGDKLVYGSDAHCVKELGPIVN